MTGSDDPSTSPPVITAEALAEREARLRSILETVPDAIIVIDANGLVESFSPSAERIFGYRAEEIVGRSVSLLMPAPYRDRHDDYLARYLTTGQKRIIGVGRIVSGRRKDGSTFPMELAVGEVALGPRRLFTGFVRDITERQHTERRLQEMQAELLHVSRLSAMGQMGSSLAHELNQPLTAIGNYLQAARRLLAQSAGGAQSRIDEIMEKAAAQAVRAGQVIQRLRQFVEKGEIEHRFEDLNQVVQEASALALVGAREAEVHVDLDFSSELPPAWIDKVQIQQVVLNLVRNAVEAMETSPQRILTLRTTSGDGCVEVMVSDTGRGLDPKVAEQLFQPFVTTKDKGMGIGLSVCRSIVEAHGGRIWALPNPGSGTCFHFTVLTDAGAGARRPDEPAHR